MAVLITYEALRRCDMTWQPLHGEEKALGILGRIATKAGEDPTKGSPKKGNTGDFWIGLLGGTFAFVCDDRRE